MAMTKTFISFGGPTENYHNSVKRISEEAHKLHFFDNIHCFTEIDLKNDTDFWSKHGDFIESNVRGYGYWLWKSYLIKQQMDKMNENDILVYADAGCQINCNGMVRLNEYIELLQKNETNYGILTFQTIFQECQYTKRKIFDFFDCNNESSKNSIQTNATVIILRKNAHSIKAINEWFDICSNHYELINDDICDEFDSFIDNRHDQSIWSMIIKKYDAIKLEDETWFYNNWEVDGANFPFWARRIR
jgi:hypothetical protein